MILTIEIASGTFIRTADDYVTGIAGELAADFSSDKIAGAWSGSTKIVVMVPLTSNDLTDLLHQIFRVFLTKSDIPLNVSQVCALIEGRGKVDSLRREVGGVLYVLESLGVIQCIYRQHSLRLYTLCTPPPFDKVGRRLQEIYHAAEVAVRGEE